MALRNKAAEVFERISASLDQRQADTLLNTKQAAELLGVHKVYLDKLRTQGQGPSFIRLGPKLVRYRYCDLHNWIVRHAEVRAKPVLVPRYPPME